MEMQVSLKNLHIAPRKVRLVAGLIRGMEVARAEAELENRLKRASEPLLKLLRSGVANARHNFGLEVNQLFVKEIRVDGGPVFKSFRPRAFGRAAPLRMRTSHVSLVIGSRGEAVRPRKPAKPEVLTVSGDETKVHEEFHPAAPKEKKPPMPQDQSHKKGPVWKNKPMSFVRKVFNRKAI